MNWKLVLCGVLVAIFSYSQDLQKPSQVEQNTLPQWAQMMYAENPNVLEVDQAYTSYYKSNLFEKNYHTQYYKRWRRKINPYISSNGKATMPSDAMLLEQREYMMKGFYQEKSGTWSLLGPYTAYNGNGNPVAQQANVYSIDQSLSNSQVLYCGTEPGEIYRSNDEGNSWFNVSLNDPLSGGVSAIKINPTNPEEVLAGSGGILYRTTDGGSTWTSVLSNLNSVYELLYVVGSPNIVLAATNTGLYRSVDAGVTWSVSHGNKTWDIKSNIAAPSTLYIAAHNPTEDLSTFYISTDAGMTWTQQTNGWHTSIDAGRNDGGVRLAVSQANPNRIYAYLIGESKTGDTGYIGLYRSDDGGYNWILPNGPAGGPYSDTHMNLAIGTVNWQYHQGFYNCALMASDTNADEILLGGLNLYKSDDGGATFYPLAGYVGGPYSMHVDMQDFRNINGTAWITTDGGIYHSTDFFSTGGFDVRMNGVHSSDYWGFGQGWNEDITIGGLYHNGNVSSFDVWGMGNFLQLGGGEPASGYVNPGENRRVYSSDINGKIIPMSIGDPILNVGFGIDPNESYWAAESSEFEFDPRCYSTGYIGNDHQLWKTEDKGVSFTAMHSFGTDPDSRITYIEIARSNPSTWYVCQQMNGVNSGKLWKTTDGGSSWSELTLPLSSNTKRMLIQVDPKNANILYIAFTTGPNGQKVYKSTDGGSSWTNLSTATLNGQNVHSIALLGGSNGGLYYATNRTIYYRNNTMNDWIDFGDGLPVKVSTDIIRPFYRDGKIRLASYGKGIWESPLYEPQTEPVAQIMVDKLAYTMHCSQDTFHYVDHSMLNHSGATWNWTFEGGSPSSSDTWNAAVVYDNPGVYLTILEVTDAAGNSDIDSLYVTVNAFVPQAILNEDFENSNFPSVIELNNPDDGQTWELTTDAGGFGNSSQSMLLRGYDYWPGGDVDDARMSIDMTFLQEPVLTFDVAYARYAVNYSDTLEVLISIDCGETWVSEYYKGGTDLATRDDLGSYFIPSPDEWRKDSIDLSSYVGNNDVVVNFRSITGWGNNVYIDNINLDALDVSNVSENKALVRLYPNPSNGSEIHIETGFEEPIKLDVYSMEGKLVLRKSLAPVDVFALDHCKEGTYLVVVRTSTKIYKHLFVLQG